MRLFPGLFAPLALLACLAAPATAGQLRFMSGGMSPLVVAPAPRAVLVPGPIVIPQHSLRSSPFVQGQIILRSTPVINPPNPGPVPPLTGTIVPPFGGTAHTSVIILGDQIVIRKHRFDFGRFPHDNLDHRFDHFHGGFFPAQPFFLFDETLGPDQVVVTDNTAQEEVESPVVEAAPPPPPPPPSPAAPTRRSGRPVLTGTLEAPQIIFVSPARDSKETKVFAPQGKADTSGPQVVQLPTQ